MTITYRHEVDRPLKVAFFLADQNPHRDRSLGISTMSSSLLEQLNVREELSVCPVISKSSLSAPPSLVDRCCIPWRTDHLLGRLACDAVHPWFVRSAADLWFYPKGYLPLLSRVSVPTVGILHDAIIQYYADRYPNSRRGLGYFIRATKQSLRRLDSILTVSQHAKSQLLQFCERHGIAEPNIHVTYQSSPWEVYRGRSFVKRDYVIHLTSSAPHKQTNHLLRMWRKLQSQRRDLPQLVLVGPMDADGERLAASLARTERTGHLRHDELVRWVGEARALLLPSEVEGFGLPALEAYYVQTPVCFVRGTAVDEILGSTAAFGAFALNDIDSLMQALDHSLAASAEITAAIQRELHSRFASEICVERIVSEFFSVMERRAKAIAPPLHHSHA